MSDLGFAGSTPNSSRMYEAPLPPLPPSEKKRPPRPVPATQPTNHIADHDFAASVEFWLGKELNDSSPPQSFAWPGVSGTWPSDRLRGGAGAGGGCGGADSAVWPAPPPRPRTTGSTGRGRRPGRGGGRAGEASSAEGRKSPLSQSAGLYDTWEIPRVCPPSGQLGPCARRVYEVRQQKADEELQHRLQTTKKRIQQLESKLSQQLQQRKEAQEMEAALHAARRNGRAREEALIKDIAVVRERVEATKKRLVRLSTHNRRNQGPVSVSGIQQLGEQGQHLLQAPEQQQQPQEQLQQSLLQPASMRLESPSPSYSSGRCMSKERRPPLPMVRLYNSSRPPSELGYGQSAQVCHTSIYEEDEEGFEEEQIYDEGFPLAATSDEDDGGNMPNQESNLECSAHSALVEENMELAPSDEDMKSFTSRSPPGWESMNGEQLLALASCLQRVVGSSDPAKLPDRSPEELPSPRSLTRRLESLLKTAKAQDDVITARQQERFQRDYEHAAMGLADEESAGAEVYHQIYQTRTVRDEIDSTNKVLELVLGQLEDGCTEDFVVTLPPSVGHEESAMSMTSAASSATAARRSPRAPLGLRARPAPLLTSGLGEAVEAPYSPVSPSSGSPDSPKEKMASPSSGKRPPITVKSWLDYKDFRKAYAIEWHRQLFDQYKEVRSLNSKLAKLRDPEVDKEVDEVESQLHHHHHGLRKLCLAALSELEKWESWSARVPIALPPSPAAIAQCLASPSNQPGTSPSDDGGGDGDCRRRSGGDLEVEGGNADEEVHDVVSSEVAALEDAAVGRAREEDEEDEQKKASLADGAFETEGERKGDRGSSPDDEAHFLEKNDAQNSVDPGREDEGLAVFMGEDEDELEPASEPGVATQEPDSLDNVDPSGEEADPTEVDMGKGATLTDWNNKSLPTLGLVVTPSLEIFLRGPSAFNSEATPPESEVPRSRQSSLGSPTALFPATGPGLAASTSASRIPEEGHPDVDPVELVELAEPESHGDANMTGRDGDGDRDGDRDKENDNLLVAEGDALEESAHVEGYFPRSGELGLQQIEEELENGEEEGQEEGNGEDVAEEDRAIPELLENEAGGGAQLEGPPDVVFDESDIPSAMAVAVATVADENLEVLDECPEGAAELGSSGMEERSDHFMEHLRADGSRCLWAMSAIFLAMLQQSQDLAQFGQPI